MSKHKILFITHNSGLQRQKKLVASLSNNFEVEFPRSIFNTTSNMLLKKDIGTIFRLLELGVNSLITKRPVLVNIIAGVFFPSKFKNYILDYSTPYSLELSYLGYEKLSKIIARQEKALVKNSLAVLVPNEPLEKYVNNFGANFVKLIPNYPNLTFQSSTDSNEFKRLVGLSNFSKIAVFTAAGRLDEIYGLSILLQSWKIVEDNYDDPILVIVGPKPDSKVTKFEILKRAKKIGIKNLRVTGWVPSDLLPDWISISDVCLAPRTPGFPTEWYNDKDSTKISEYSALGKPIIATGYSFSNQYLLVNNSPEDFAYGILRSFEGNVTSSIPYYWEDNESKLLSCVEQLLGPKKFADTAP